LLWIATFFIIIILGLAFDTPKSSTLFHTSHASRFPHSKSSKWSKVGFNNQKSLFFIAGESLPSPKDSPLYMWKPPNDGGRKGYYNFNERGDFDPDKLNRYRRGNKWNRKSSSLISFSSIKRFLFPSSLFASTSKIWTAQKCLIYLNILAYAFQLLTAMLSTPQLNEALSLSNGYSGALFSPFQILERNLLGKSTILLRGPPMINNVNPSISSLLYRPIKAASTGPFTMDFMFLSLFAKVQPHRFLSAGFLHGSIFHLYFNMRYLSQFPRWVEFGLGKSLYLSVFLASIVSGNIAHYVTSTSSSASASACLGASGGICGLYGFLFIMYRKLNRSPQSWSVLRSMAFIFIFGAIADNISNASHFGGFIGGLLLGYLCSPNFRKSYVAKRKVWFDDDSEQGLRRIMGPEVVETAPFVSLGMMWALMLALGIWYQPSVRLIPLMAWKGLTHPGSLSGMSPLY